MKKMKWVLFIIIGCVIVLVIQKSPKRNEAPKEEENQIIFDANQYARISYDDLVNILGEPKSTQDWNSITSGGEYPMTLYTYDLQDAYVEFVIYEDAVVKIQWFANSPVEIKDDLDNVFKMFNITVNDNAKKIADTGSTYKFSPVSDTVGEFDVFNFDSDAHTFDTVYITYNLNYFD